MTGVTLLDHLYADAAFRTTDIMSQFVLQVMKPMKLIAVFVHGKMSM